MQMECRPLHYMGRKQYITLKKVDVIEAPLYILPLFIWWYYILCREHVCVCVCVCVCEAESLQEPQAYPCKQKLPVAVGEGSGQCHGTPEGQGEGEGDPSVDPSAAGQQANRDGGQGENECEEGSGE